ncbi:MAG: DnaD domain protein [Bacilli bacterium]
MFNKVKNMISKKDIVVPSILFYNKNLIGINYEELYFLEYLINTTNNEFDISKICSELNEKPKVIIKVLNDLEEKKLISVDTVKENDDNRQIINLDELYKKLTYLIVEEEDIIETPKVDIKKEFEQAFKRDLIAREKKIIDAWKMVGYSDDFVLAGLKEAIYNGQINLTYVDTILDNWDKQGFKTEEDILKSKTINTETIEITEPLVEIDESYDWMNE